jgi:hypothetical protein
MTLIVVFESRFGINLPDLGTGTDASSTQIGQPHRSKTVRGKRAYALVSSPPLTLVFEVA